MKDNKNTNTSIAVESNEEKNPDMERIPTTNNVLMYLQKMDSGNIILRVGSFVAELDKEQKKQLIDVLRCM